MYGMVKHGAETMGITGSALFLSYFVNASNFNAPIKYAGIIVILFWLVLSLHLSGKQFEKEAKEK